MFSCKIGVLSDVEKVETPFTLYLFVFFFSVPGRNGSACMQALLATFVQTDETKSHILRLYVDEEISHREAQGTCSCAYVMKCIDHKRWKKEVWQ